MPRPYRSEGVFTFGGEGCRVGRAGAGPDAVCGQLFDGEELFDGGRISRNR
jgi:hypothetical protein